MKESLTTSLSGLGITELNAMQKDMLAAWPRYRDIVLLSPTGTGKTLAFLVPLLETMEPSDEVSAVIISPSRELAQQTEAVIRSLRLPIRSLSLTGGRPAMEEHRKLQELAPQVIVATPGRLRDHLLKGNIRLSSSVSLVIDEFDKCLELGFQEDMEDILRRLPPPLVRVLLSATDMASIPGFLERTTQERRSRIRLDFSSGQDTASLLRSYRVLSPDKDKMDTCLSLLCHLGQTSSIVFLNYRESVDRLAGYLKKAGFPVSRYHGALEQEERERSLLRFRAGASLALISTDLASRGLDIDGVDQVIHYHLPSSQEALTHRDGRTARMGRPGQSFLILGPEEMMPEFMDENMPSLRLPSERPVMPVPQYASLYIGRGKRDRLSRGDVVGFLCKTGGLASDDIRRIDLMDHACYVSVRREVAFGLLPRVRGQKIKGMKTLIEPAR